MINISSVSLDYIYLLYFLCSNLIGEVCVLEDMTSHLPVIEIRIEECRGKRLL